MNLFTLGIWAFVAMGSGDASPEGTATLMGTLDNSAFETSRRSAARYARGSRSRPGEMIIVGAVWLEGHFAPQFYERARKEQAEVVQRGLQFEHNVTVVTVGGEVAFPNKDDTFHNVFSYAPGNSFDLGRYRPTDDPPSRRFDKVSEIPLFCEIHRHMRATILVVDSPFHTRTNISGDYRIGGVPPGRYTLKAWFAQGKTVSREVTLTTGETLKLDLSAE